jgi:hypothetical protein
MIPDGVLVAAFSGSLGGRRVSTESTTRAGRVRRVTRGRTAREAVSFCIQRRNLRRTLSIALIVGIVLTAINRGAVISSRHATTATWIRCALNFVVPFLVSNAGLLSARR